MIGHEQITAGSVMPGDEIRYKGDRFSTVRRHPKPCTAYNGCVHIEMSKSTWCIPGVATVDRKN